MNAENLKPSHKDRKNFSINLYSYLLYPSHKLPHFWIGLVLFLFSVTLSFGQCHIYVDHGATGANNGNDWSNAYTDLQVALSNTCSSPSTTIIHVAEGTYKPTTGTDRTISFSMKNNVEIRGGYQSGGSVMPSWENYPTILSGDIGSPIDSTDNSYQVIANTGIDATAVLNGFIITEGNANWSSPYNYGGGMYNDNADPTIINCSFQYNYGGAGGGMYNDTCDPVLTNCLFLYNASDLGGAVFNHESSPSMTSCDFSNNAAYEGGAIFSSSSSDGILLDCSFSNNSSQGSGGGMYIEHSSPDITNCSFSENSARYGGGIYSSLSTPVLTNCAFWKNTAISFGAGYQNFNSSTSTLINCSFSKNEAGTDSDGISNSGSAILNLTNCILWGNGTVEISGDGTGTENLNLSIIKGGYAGTAIFNVNPLFVNSINGNLRLRNCSAAKDIGDNTANTTTLDLEGNPRMYNAGIIDLGAYEGQSLCDNECVNDQISFKHIYLPSGTYHAISTLLSKSIINPPSNVEFKAGSSITLSPGFDIQVGAAFLAEIESCGAVRSSEESE